jgi:hypothetical protein
MRSARIKILVALAALIVAFPAATSVVAQDADDSSAQVVLDWNQNALATIGAAGGPPATAGLFLAMVHGAIYDAVVSIAGGYEPYLGQLEADPTASKVAAAASAAHGVLTGLFPDQAADLQALLDTSLGAVPDGAAKDAGVAVGQAAAAAMLADREGDGRGGEHPLAYGEGPGEYRPTPPDFSEFGAAWVADVRPFLADSAEYYRTEGPYALDSAEYAAEFDEVKALGAAEGSTRTPEDEALIAFWVTPVGQWSGVERALATSQGLDIVEAARLFAISGLAAGDAIIGAFNDKYNWMFWRPVTAIHEAENDGNDATEADPEWVPYVDSVGETTPPYPDHPSGWNTYAGAIVGAMQEYFGTDEMEYNIGSPNVEEPRSYTSFSQGLEDGILLRILHGLHFRNPDVQAVELGQKAAALAAERLAATE